MEEVFYIQNQKQFHKWVFKAFRYQYENNLVYQTFCNHLQRNPSNVKEYTDLPFLPISFFKSHEVVSGTFSPQSVFTSSGTTGQTTSRHLVKDLALYEQSFLSGFSHFYGNLQDYCILALLPSYLEREGSSLVYMAKEWMETSAHTNNGFYLHDYEKLATTLLQLEKEQQPTILLGVTYALLDLAEQFSMALKHTIVMETGGMKGKRKEMVRSELHETLQNAFQTPNIHSEYGMTELLSQAYSFGNGIFECPPWMRVFARQTEDPLSMTNYGTTGGINIIDLANWHSCSFIATEDLGKVYENGSFEILGRFDFSDVRGCNLMVQ